MPVALATTNSTTFPLAAVKVVLAWAVNRGCGVWFIRKRQTHQKAVHARGSECCSVVFFVERGYKNAWKNNFSMRRMSVWMPERTPLQNVLLSGGGLNRPCSPIDPRCFFGFVAARCAAKQMVLFLLSDCLLREEAWIMWTLRVHWCYGEFALIKNKCDECFSSTV